MNLGLTDLSLFLYSNESIYTMLNTFIFELSRPQKRAVSLFIDTILLTSAFFLAYWTRLGGIVAFDNTEIWVTLLCTIVVTLFTFSKLGLY